MDQLVKTISQTNDLMRITHEICSYFNNPCMIVNANYKVISYAITKNFKDEVFSSAIMRREMTYEFVSRFEEEKKDYFYLNIAKSPYKRRISCLICEGLVVGYLLIVDETEDLLERFTLEQFQIIEGLLAKQLVFNEQNGNIFTNSVDQFLLSLLNENISDERLLNLKINQLFRNKFYPDSLAIIDIHNYHSIDFLDDSLKNDIRYHIPNSHTMIYDGNILVFYPSDEKVAFYTLAEHYRLNIICSETFQKLYRVKEIYSFSNKALTMAKVIHKDYFVDDAKRYSLLLTFAALSTKETYIASEIIKIRDYDISNKTKYLELLYLYLKNGKSLQKTCADLFVHRNTVLYRLNRLRDEFNLDLTDANKLILYSLMSGILLYSMQRYDLFLL